MTREQNVTRYRPKRPTHGPGTDPRGPHGIGDLLDTADQYARQVHLRSPAAPHGCAAARGPERQLIPHAVHASRNPLADEPFELFPRPIAMGKTQLSAVPSNLVATNITKIHQQDQPGMQSSKHSLKKVVAVIKPFKDNKLLRTRLPITRSFGG